MGYFIRFIHNRDLACENIMTSYCRFRLVLDSAPGAVSELLDRVEDAGLRLPAHSFLKTTGELRRLRGQLPGEFGVDFKVSRRNSRKLNYDSLPPSLVTSVGALLRHWGHPAGYHPAQGAKWTKMTAGQCIMPAC